MAAANGKKGYTIRFELSLAGLLGLGVVCFCIFLWMFLLGLWAGQTGMISGISFSTPPAIPPLAKVEAAKGKLPEPPEVAPEPEPAPAPAAAPSEPKPEPVPSAAPGPAGAAPSEEPEAKVPAAPAYAIQVGAFRDSRYVEEAVQKWRARGYEVFSRPPSGEYEHLTKVYLGHFLDADTARNEAEALAKKDKITPIVVAIPAEAGMRP